MSKIIGIVTDKGLLKAADENGVLKIGNIIFPQKKVLYENAEGVSISNAFEFRIDNYYGKTIEMEYELVPTSGGATRNIIKVKFGTTQGSSQVAYPAGVVNGTMVLASFYGGHAVRDGAECVYINIQPVTVINNATANPTLSYTGYKEWKLYRIWEIIE